MKILVTGHAGFLGAKLTSSFLRRKHAVIGIDIKKTRTFKDYKNFSQYKINLSNSKKIHSLFKRIKKVDFVIHAAAKQPIKKDNNLEKYLKTNFYGTKILLEACRDFGVKKIIYCSSFSVYGITKSPIREDMTPNPRNTYGLSKYLAENLIRSFSNQFNIRTIILRLDGIYGNNQNLPGFIKTSSECAFRNKEVLLFSKGKLKRNQAYVDDVVKAINLAVKNSDIIVENNNIYFSNNKNEFFALDERTGTIRWNQKLNSNLRPTYLDGLVFTVTLEGYLAIIDSRNGNLVRMTNIFDKIKNHKKKNIKPEGFIITKEKVYLSLNNGRLIIIDILTGKALDVIKIDNEKISRPYIFNNEMFIVKDNAILKLN